MDSPRKALLVVAAACVCGAGLPARSDAQRRGVIDQMSQAFGGDDYYWRHPAMNNVDYDGQFVLARVWYSGVFANGGEGPGWAHDFPSSEYNLANIIKEITVVRPYLNGGNIFKLDDPEMLKFPLAYLSEPGGWFPTQSEIEGLRNYIQKGGFIIFDDYRYGNGSSMNDPVIRGFQGMKAAFPKLNPQRLDASHPIFDAFFHITDLTIGLRNPSLQFWGIYEDNDPKKRLIAIFDLNEDVGDYWQAGLNGRNPIDMSTDAFKLGVNYLIYAMTH